MQRLLFHSNFFPSFLCSLINLMITSSALHINLGQFCTFLAPAFLTSPTQLRLNTTPIPLSLSLSLSLDLLQFSIDLHSDLLDDLLLSLDGRGLC
jgi:hypothetical protein